MPALPIAIVGISGRYSGGADNIDQLWSNLKAGVDGVIDWPEGRWDRGYHNPERDRKGRSYTYAGGYLKDVAGFDADFFGISPREAQQMDPQHRLLLELTWEALEDANILPSSMVGTATGVFIGLSSRDYADLSDDTSINAYTNIGLSMSLASNRISYIFDLKGPSFTVDTACSSGMVAVHQARMALERGECTSALVGACNLLISPKAHIGFSKASMLSPAGRCTSFDANGAGYVRAEGGGILVLKPLKDAERDGNRILGVLVGSGVNSDGRTVGIALPNVNAQEALLRQVYGEANLQPNEVFYLEAHGTGTAVGDPIECEAIARVLGGERRDSALHIGSIKSNVGHLEPAAGIAGLTKVLLSLKHGSIPANLHFKTPNPKIRFEDWKLKVVDQPTTLPNSDAPLYMGVNSFGFGGTNAHAIVQRYTPTEATAKRKIESKPWTDLLVISAQSDAALAAASEQWIKLLRNAPQGEDAADYWSNLRAAAIHNRARHTHRICLHASSSAEALMLLEGRAQEKSSRHLAEAKSPTSGRARTAWVYSGNGPQWWAMGRELITNDPTFRTAVERVDEIFKGLAGWSIIDELMRDETSSRMALTEVAQPALFALQVGLTEILRAAGLTAEAVFGHSVGEAAAAWASGALTLEQATTVIHHRSALQGTTAGMGKMAALGISPADAKKLIAKIGGFLELAAVNSPSAVTVAGDPVQLERIVAEVTEAGSFARLLTLDYAFHTAAMDSIRERLLTNLDGLSPNETTIPFISTVEGTQVDGAHLNADYWWRNVREPVAFESATNHALEALQINAFIEVGPHPVLRDYLNQCSKARSLPATSLTTLRRPRGERSEPEIATLWQTICAAHASGMGDLSTICDKPTTHIELPLYPWQRTAHWRGEQALPDLRPAYRRVHPLLGWQINTSTTTWDSIADTHLNPYLLDHVIEDAPVFPAAGYIEMTLAAAAELFGDVPAQLEDVDILKPLVIAPGQAPIMQLQADAADGTFAITSRAAMEESDTTTHFKGRVTKAEPSHQPPRIDIARLYESLTHPTSAEAHYEGALRRGMYYGPAFQSVQEVRLSNPDDGVDLIAGAWIEIPKEIAEPLPLYRSHPAILDGALQVLITLLAQHEPRQCACIPIFIGRLRLFAPLPARLFCKVQLLTQSERSGTAAFYLYDESGTCVMSIDGTRFQKVDFGSAGSAMRIVDHWRRDTAANGNTIQSIQLPSADALVAQMPPAPSASPSWHVDAIAGVIAAETLARLAETAGLGAGTGFRANTLQRRARIVEEYQPLFRALLQMAEEDGWLKSEGQDLTWSAQERPSAASLLSKMAHTAPVQTAEMMLLAQLAENLPGLLRGESSPIIANRAERSHPSFEALLSTAPFSANIHKRAADLVQQLMQAWPVNRPVRALELNAHAGALTDAVLPLFPTSRSAYLLTDKDEDTVTLLRRRFAQGQSVHTTVFDLGNAAACTSFADQFDLILCNDILTATNLPAAEALTRVREMLAPGGILIAVSPQATRLSTLLFGQDPTWWRAGTPPLVGDNGWSDAWAKSGWSETKAIPDSDNQQILWVAKKDAASPETTAIIPPVNAAQSEKHWLLLTDTTAQGIAFAKDVASELIANGQRVRTQCVAAAADQENAVLVSDVDGFARTLTAPLDFVVQLAGLTTEAPTASEQLDLQQVRCTPLFSLAQALKKDGPDLAERPRPKLRVVTHAALLGPSASPKIHPEQAPVWGIARVLTNEHADLAPKLIDLQTALDAVAARRLALELLREDGESEVLLDPTDRWVRRATTASQTSLAKAAQSLPGAHTTENETQGVRLIAPQQGGLDALYLRSVPRETPKPSQVEIKIHAAGLNFRDVLWAMNMLPEEAVEYGFSGATIGMECAGEVVAIGDGVKNVTIGDRVIGFASGCFASHVTTQASAIAKIPSGLTWEEAATIPTAFLTAMYALDHLARLQPGEKVLIHGAAGGVGLAAVQIAKLLGAEVFGTAGNDDKRRLLNLYGVDHVLDSRSLAFAEDVMELTGGEGIDVVLNSLAGEAITKNLQILRPFGRMLEIGKRDFYANSRIGLRPFRQNLSYFGIDADTLLIERPALAQTVFNQVAELFGEGKLRPIPFQAIPISRAPQAFRLMQQSRHVGKIVITVPEADRERPQSLPADWQASSDGVYFVTGGLGGFGLASAKWLVERGVRSIALMSRRGATTDEAKSGIAAMEALGAKVVAYTGDVSNAEDLSRVLTSIRKDQGPLRGVLHSAMVLDDAPALMQNGERLKNVLAPKLVGAWLLHEQTRNDQLDAFIVYSSATTVVGNPGQSNYVAANLYLESLIELRRAQGLPGLAICWGSIKDVGVITRTEGLDALVQQRAGITAIPSEQCLAELGRMLAANASVVSVAQFNLQRLAEILPATRTPRFSILAPERSGSGDGAQRQTLAERIPTTPAADRRALVLDTIREHLGRILGAPAAKIELEKPLPDLGLDSLMAVELAQSLEQECGRPVSVMQMIQASSAIAVGDMLLAGFEAKADG